MEISNKHLPDRSSRSIRSYVIKLLRDIVEAPDDETIQMISSEVLKIFQDHPNTLFYTCFAADFNDLLSKIFSPSYESRCYIFSILPYAFDNQNQVRYDDTQSPKYIPRLIYLLDYSEENPVDHDMQEKILNLTVLLLNLTNNFPNDVDILTSDVITVISKNLNNLHLGNLIYSILKKITNLDEVDSKILQQISLILFNIIQNIDISDEISVEESYFGFKSISLLLQNNFTHIDSMNLINFFKNSIFTLDQNQYPQLISSALEIITYLHTQLDDSIFVYVFDYISSPNTDIMSNALSVFCEFNNSFRSLEKYEELKSRLIQTISESIFSNHTLPFPLYNKALHTIKKYIDDDPSMLPMNVISYLIDQIVDAEQIPIIFDFLDLIQKHLVMSGEFPNGLTYEDFIENLKEHADDLYDFSTGDYDENIKKIAYDLYQLVEEKDDDEY